MLDVQKKKMDKKFKNYDELILILLYPWQTKFCPVYLYVLLAQLLLNRWTDINETLHSCIIKPEDVHELIKIANIQKRTTRMILDKSWDHPSNPLFKELNCLPLQSCITF